MKLIRNVHVYAPEDLGVKDVLVEGNKIIRIEKGISAGAFMEVTEGGGMIMTPGFIDMHEHITGGGGEGGFATRCPEASFTELVRSGVTSVVGLLGTDGITRSLPNLLAKTRELNEEGITAWCLSGSYGYPPVTLCGSVEKDIVFVNEMIGVKTAVSDHRGSNPGWTDLVNLGTQVRRAGLLSHKTGFVTVHMGDGKKGLEPLMEAMENSDLPWNTFLPTHMSRNRRLLEEGMAWIKQGGYMDITADDDEKTVDAVLFVLENGGSERLTVTSDAYGSMPQFDKNGNYLGLDYVTPVVLLKLFRVLLGKNVPVERALSLFTVNPAKVLKMEGHKGRICVGADADLLMMKDNMELVDVMAEGRWLLKDGQAVVRGTFERQRQ